MRTLALFGMVAISVSQASSGPRVDLTPGVGQPGGETIVSIALDPSGVQVTATENQLAIPPLLSFASAEIGEAGKSVSADVKAEPGGGGSQAQKWVVKVQAPEGKMLPQGVLAQLKFKISQEAGKEKLPLELTVENKAFVTGAQQSKVAVEGNPGIVSVVEEVPPVMACFFYMH